MAKATSPVSGQPYGIQRACQLWGVPRSSFYAAQAPAPESALPAAPPARRGPRPAITDAALLAAIKRDLETSTWTGEGHRKVWARLRVRDRLVQPRVQETGCGTLIVARHNASIQADCVADA